MDKNGDIHSYGLLNEGMCGVIKMGKDDNNNKQPNKFDKDGAIFNPAAFFNWPSDIVEEKRLTFDEKRQALTNWELDIRLNNIAVEENMPDLLHKRKNLVTLQDVHLARGRLGDFPGEHGSTSKLGM